MVTLQSFYVCTFVYIVMMTNIFLVSPAILTQTSRNIEDALRVHNEARAQAVGPPRSNLTWSSDLANAAQAWADYLANSSTMRHSSGSGQGENLYAVMGRGECSFAAATKSWVAEKQFYHGQPIPQGDFESYGHYTQVIWPRTQEVGMGIAKSARGGWTYVVARYSPPGNYMRQTAWS